MLAKLMLLTQIAGSPDPLTGLWAARTMSGPTLRGPVTVRRHGNNWTAEVGPTRATATGTDAVTIRFADGLGELRISRAGPRMIGFWIQPAGTTLTVPFATPIPLTRGVDGAWRGRIRPVDDTFSLFLQIKRVEDGTLTGAFRNPDFNWRGGASSFLVMAAGDSLRFRDRAENRERLAVGYDSAGRRILMDFGSPVVLKKAGSAAAEAFWPRMPGGPPPAYRRPRRVNDGWVTARARSVGLSEDTLAALIRTIAATDPTGPGGAAIHSVSVARYGKLVLDEYFHGFGPDTLHDLRSASKTLTSIMAGVAIGHGWLSRDAGADSVFGLATTDPRRRGITLARLLTHTSGLDCDDNDDASPGSEERLQTQHDQPDWYRYMLALPLKTEPGSHYAYCSGGMHLGLGMVARAGRLWGPDLFQRYLAGPLDITHYAINLTPTGEAYGGGGMRLRPRDLLKFGQVYLDGGVWRGRRIVSGGWVRTSVAHQTDTPSGSDGYAWHRFRIRAGNREYEEFEANGNGGQFLIVLPELGMTIVFTAGNYMQYGIWRKFREELLPRFLIGAVARPISSS